MDARAFVARILDQPRVVSFRTVLDTYGRAAGGLLANGLAFSALFAAIPATLLVLGLAGWFAAGDATIQQQVSDALSAAVPPLADLIRGSVDAVADGAALTSVIGVVGVIWTVSQLLPPWTSPSPGSSSTNPSGMCFGGRFGALSSSA